MRGYVDFFAPRFLYVNIPNLGGMWVLACGRTFTPRPSQHESHRHANCANQRQSPEDVDVGKELCLAIDGFPN